MPGEAGFTALRDRAYALLAQAQPVTEAALLQHVYGGQPPPAIHARLVAPLLDDPRFERRPDGLWTVATANQPPGLGDLSVIAVLATGPSPERARIAHLAALHVRDGAVVARFSASLNPGVRVPGYVAERIGLEVEVLNDLPPFAAVADELLAFLGGRPICGQDARLTWAFIEAECRRAGRTLREPVLVDLNRLAQQVPGLQRKPTLARVAMHFGIPIGRIDHPDEQARVTALVLPHLLREPAVACPGQDQPAPRALPQPPPLRRGRTVRDQPDQPGVYVLRDAQHAAVYVGKARHLRSRLAAYVHRPLGPTRRFEGLLDAVESVASEVCATDLEALILEDHEIRRLAPRFNTVLEQHPPRLWLRLPPLPVPARGKRARAPRRIELVADRATDGEHIGPFRNEAAAEHARWLAKRIFGLDPLRRQRAPAYERALANAWRLLSGDPEPAWQQVRVDQAAAVRAHDSQRLLDVEHLIAALRTFDPASLLLPADPRQARYAVVRPPSGGGSEVFVLDGCVLVGWAVVSTDPAQAQTDITALLAEPRPRTQTDDAAVVLRWLGAQRAPTRLVHLPADAASASACLEDVVLAAVSGEA